MPKPLGAPALAESPPVPPGEVLRRTLLILVTTLVVARPAVLGEDPGMLTDLSDPSNMVLTLLWFAAAVVWAVWRLLARSEDAEAGERKWWPPSGAVVVEVALLATALLVFLSTWAAAYKHPARLIAWEWLGLFLAFFVVRRMAGRPADQQGLLTALLAGAVALSAHGVYQEFVELPRFRREVVQKPETVRAALAQRGLTLEADDPYLTLLHRRALDNHVFGTYAHPNSFAGVLALLLPGLAGAAWFSFRARRRAWQTGLVLGCVLLGGAALLLTHSRGAVGALVLVGLIAAAVAGRRFWRTHRIAVAAALLALAAAAYGVYASGLLTAGIGKESRTAALRLEYWRRTWHIITGNPWLGVGPGNFGSAYTRLMDENVEEPIKDPHNFALEVWATSGIFALIALLTALAAFFATTLRGADGKGSHSEEGRQEGLPHDEPPLRWEYYVGGVFGLLLGFVLRAGESQTGDVWAEAAAAGVRSVAWFAAFGLLEHIPWTARGRSLALTAGVAALLLNLTVSGGIAFPSVAGLMWVVMAVALAAARTKEARTAKARPAEPATRFVPLPVFAALALSYLVYAFVPVTSGRSLVQKGEEAGRAILDQIERNPRATFREPFRDFRQKVTGPLDEAAREDPDDARIQTIRAGWYWQLWRLELMGGIDHRLALPEARMAVEAAVRAQQLDPRGARGYLTEYQLHEHFAEILQLVAQKQSDKERKEEKEKEVREEHRRGARALARHVPDDPANPILRYRIAEVFFKAGDEAEGKEAATAALALDLRTKGPGRRLTDPQRKELRKRLGLPESE
jgi:O-antigen ligase